MSACVYGESQSIISEIAVSLNNRRNTKVMYTKSMSRITRSKNRGFTIVKLLIVIVVIGILAAITIVAYNGIQERGKVARANSDLASLQKAIMLARVNQNKTLLQITGYGCTCGGSSTAAAIDAIAAASGANLSGIKAGDPWGNVYYFDENEGEGGASNCTKDVLTVSGSHPGVNSLAVPTFTC